MQTSSSIKVLDTLLGTCLVLCCSMAWSAGETATVQGEVGGVGNYLHEPDKPGITEYADADVRIYLTHPGKKERNARAAQRKREELVIEPTGQPSYRVRLEEGDQLAELHRYQDRLIVVAWHNSIGLSTVTILDWRSGKKLDSFLAIKPAVSPSGRHVAFVRMYQMHGINTWEDQIRAYDVTKLPRENRSGQAAEAGNEEAGLAVYPKVGKDGQVPNNVRVPHTVSLESPLVWSADSSEVGALMERQKKYFVVRATGAAFAEVARYDIPDAKAFCLPGHEAASCGGSLKDDGVALELAPQGVTLRTLPSGRTAANAQLLKREWFKTVR